MTYQRTGYYRPDTGITDLVSSFWGLASAGVQFTVNQASNAFSLLTEPTAAMSRVRASMDDLSGTLARTYEAPADTFTAVMEDDLNGRKA